MGGNCLDRAGSWVGCHHRSTGCSCWVGRERLRQYTHALKTTVYLCGLLSPLYLLNQDHYSLPHTWLLPKKGTEFSNTEFQSVDETSEHSSKHSLRFSQKILFSPDTCTYEFQQNLLSHHQGCGKLRVKLLL